MACQNVKLTVPDWLALATALLLASMEDAVVSVFVPHPVSSMIDAANTAMVFLIPNPPKGYVCFFILTTYQCAGSASEWAG
ncbi:hypothetical protein D1872_322950 [compost metagenome]